MANKYVFVFLALMVLVTVVSIGEAVRFAPGAFPVPIRFGQYRRPSYGYPHRRPYGRYWRSPIEDKIEDKRIKQWFVFINSLIKVLM